MRVQRPTTQIALLSTVLGMAILGNVAVLYYVSDSTIRLGIGGVLLAVIMLLSARLGVVSRVAQLLIKGYKRRKFVKLRGVVDEFIDEVRRLNWAAEGAQRGFRSEMDANQDMDAAERRLHELVGRIRESAGHVTPLEDQPNPERIMQSGGLDAAGALDEGGG